MSEPLPEFIDDPLLDARGISKRFAGIIALAQATVQVAAGEFVAVIGPNGAGKSTLFNCLTGVLRPDSGSVTFDGRSLDRLRPSRRAKLGIGRTFQRIELFGGMTVGDHLLVADRAHTGRGGLFSDLFGRSNPTTAEIARCERVLELVGLSDYAERPAESLSLGKGRLVELARALMTEPRLLFLDEPSSGLDKSETIEMGEALETVRTEAGTAIVLIEHDVPMVQRLAARTYVLDYGQLIAAGPTEEVLDDPKVRTAYLGVVLSTAGPLLTFENVEACYGPFRALFGVSFTLDAGSALALVGPNGAGKSTVARVASGLVAPTSGRVLVDGEDLTGKPPFRFARSGIAHAPEGRAVFATLTVEENLRLAFHEGKVDGGVSSGLDLAFELFPRLGERRKQAAGTLSGGEQRMLTLARVLVLKPKLLIADELSLGLAPIVTADVYRVLHQVRDAGCALLVVEQHLDHALELADHVVTLAQGEVGYAGPPSGLGDLSSSVLLPVGAPARAELAEQLRGESDG